MSFGATIVYSISWDCETKYCSCEYHYDAALGSYTFLCPRVLNDRFSCVKMSTTFVFSQRACYILSGSFSTSTNDRMINVFTLVRASQNESPNSRYPRNPYCSWAILYKDCSFSPGLTPVTPPFGNTSLSERLLEISLTTSMLDLRKKKIKGFRSNQTLFGLTLYS